ncbi:MAG: 30S ribosomal protein S6 [Spirochaetales bacterium]|jgi:small subunit ribosomal protein S6|nr:30S ribosomal protein S6 [Spirochaetales bacterium]
MHKYEVVFVFVPEEDRFKAGLETIREELKKAEGVISKEEDMGLRELAYPIRKESQGHYFCFYAEINPAAVIAIDQAAKLQKNVLKFLFVRKDG